MFKKCFISCLTLFFALPTFALDLKQTFELAKAQDQAYLGALSLSHAESYQPDIAWSKIYPHVDLNANTQYHYQSIEPKRYNQNTYTATVTQSLFELDQWARIAQANKQASIGTLASQLAMMDLIARTTQAYLDILAAQDQLRYAEQNEQSLKEQYSQTEKRFQVGSIAQSDLLLMGAAYAQAQAVTLQQSNNVNISQATLMRIIGTTPEALKPLDKEFNPTLPEPNNQNAWVETALSKNLNIRQSMLRTQILKDDIWIAGSEYLPSFKASATRTGYSNRSLSTSRVQNSTLGATMNWNLFNGLGSFSSVRKANYTHIAGLQTLEDTRRQVAMNVRQDYLNLVAGLSQIKAFAQAVSSAETSFNAAQVAYQAGTYTIAAVLQEQSRLFSSEQQYASAKYDFIQNWVQLKLDTGVLSEEDITVINHFLAASD